eukprot:5831232-Amphidinium_carterae.1
MGPLHSVDDIGEFRASCSGCLHNPPFRVVVKIKDFDNGGWRAIFIQGAKVVLTQSLQSDCAPSVSFL